MRVVPILVFFIVLLAGHALACVNLSGTTDGGSLCSGTYEIEELGVNGTLKGNGSTFVCQNKLKTGVIIGSDAVRVSNLTVSGCGNAVYIEGHEDVLLSDVRLMNSTNGLVLVDSSDIRIVESNITSNTRSIFAESSGFETRDSAIEPAPYIQDSPETSGENESGMGGEGEPSSPENNESGEENETVGYSPDVYEVNMSIDEESMRSIFTDVLLHVNISDEEREDLVDSLVADYTAHYKDEIEVTRRFRVYEEHTEVTLDISSTRSLPDARIYEEIPKCAAQYTEEMTFSSEKPRVIKNDPLIMWDYEEIDAQSVRYLVQDSLPPACQDMFRTAIIPQSSKLNQRIEEIEAEGRSRTHVLALSVLLGVVFMLVIYAIWQRR